MPLNLTVGACALPLDADLITGRVVRAAADPLLQKIGDLLKASLNSELQAALDVVKSDTSGAMQTVVTTVIPDRPAHFIAQIPRELFPLLFVYRLSSDMSGVEDNQVVSSWVAEYVMPEVSAVELGTMLGFAHAAAMVMGLTLNVGHHSAYDSDAPITTNMRAYIKPGVATYGNWQLVDDKTGSSIMFPSASLTFTTTEQVLENENGGADEPLENVGVVQNLVSEDDGTITLAFVTSELEDLDQ